VRAAVAVRVAAIAAIAALLAIGAPAAVSRLSANAVAAAPAVGIAPAGAPAAELADTSKLAKEDVAIQPRAVLRGKDKTCCGYPLSEELGFQLTFYWLAFEDDFAEPASTVPAGNKRAPASPSTWVELYTPQGYFIARVPEKFAWSLRMEGSGVMLDGRIYNFAGPCRYGYGTCFTQVDVSEFPFGRGAGMRALMPFKSVAVDPRLIKLGEPLYLPELDGVLLPDGSIHDGCVRADDVGGAIKQRHMDFFAVTYSNYRLLIDQLLGVGWVTPHIEAPRCEYLRVP
jgi:3D (Asp-Asp-Asp) domain-containing protein